MNKNLIMDYESTTLRNAQILANFEGNSVMSIPILKKNDIMWEVIPSELDEKIVSKAFQDFMQQNGFSFDDEELARYLDMKIRSELRMMYEKELILDLELLKNELLDIRSSQIKKYPNELSFQEKINQLSEIVFGHLNHKLINDYSAEKDLLIKINQTLEIHLMLYIKFNQVSTLIIKAKDILFDNPIIAVSLKEDQKNNFEYNKNLLHGASFSDFKDFKDKDVPIHSNEARKSVFILFMKGRYDLSYIIKELSAIPA
jgi:hypothetical protein